jgi:hypothetical protein
MLQLTPEQVAAIQAAAAKQQAQWLAAYNQATGRSITAPASSDQVSATQRAVFHARAEQMASERVVRIVIGLVVVMTIAAALWLLRRRLSVWHAIGVVVYLAVFHGVYYGLEERTYSLSSVLGTKDIILAGVLTAGLAFVAACGIVLWRAGALRQGPIAAANASLGAGLVTLAVVAIPAVIGYAINGLVITWTLPDFAWMFFTFLTLLQLTGIGIVALLAAALSAGASFLVPKAS